MQIRTLAAALLLSTSAAASTVEYPAPVAVPDGLILTLSEQGRPSFNPADGIHQLLGGKTAPERAAQSVQWAAAPEGPGTKASRPSRPTFPLPPGLIDNPACERAQGRPWFCGGHEEPPQSPPSVPLSESAWLLLLGLIALAFLNRKETT